MARGCVCVSGALSVSILLLPELGRTGPAVRLDVTPGWKGSETAPARSDADSVGWVSPHLGHIFDLMSLVCMRLLASPGLLELLFYLVEEKFLHGCVISHLSSVLTSYYLCAIMLFSWHKVG